MNTDSDRGCGVHTALTARHGASAHASLQRHVEPAGDEALLAIRRSPVVFVKAKESFTVHLENSLSTARRNSLNHLAASCCAEPAIGKDKVIFVTKEDHEAPSSAELIADDPNDPYEEHGLILPNGDINWNCPCLGGMASGPCGEQFKSAFSCFHYSKEEVKGSDCLDQFRTMQECMQRYPDLYPQDEEVDEEEEEEESDKAKSNLPAQEIPASEGQGSS
ncbi:mitochondrial intermembrane space import and assembly protein 40-like [Cetorhinus maximus]